MAPATSYPDHQPTNTSMTRLERVVAFAADLAAIVGATAEALDWW